MWDSNSAWVGLCPRVREESRGPAGPFDFAQGRLARVAVPPLARSARKQWGTGASAEVWEGERGTRRTRIGVMAEDWQAAEKVFRDAQLTSAA